MWKATYTRQTSTATAEVQSRPYQGKVDNSHILKRSDVCGVAKHARVMAQLRSRGTTDGAEQQVGSLVKFCPHEDVNCDAYAAVEEPVLPYLPCPPVTARSGLAATTALSCACEAEALAAGS